MGPCTLTFDNHDINLITTVCKLFNHLHKFIYNLTVIIIQILKPSRPLESRQCEVGDGDPRKERDEAYRKALHLAYFFVMSSCHLSPGAITIPVAACFDRSTPDIKSQSQSQSSFLLPNTGYTVQRRSTMIINMITQFYTA